MNKPFNKVLVLTFVCYLFALILSNISGSLLFKLLFVLLTVLVLTFVCFVLVISSSLFFCLHFCFVLMFSYFQFLCLFFCLGSIVCALFLSHISGSYVCSFYQAFICFLTPFLTQFLLLFYCLCINLFFHTFLDGAFFQAFILLFFFTIFVSILTQYSFVFFRTCDTH